MHTHPDMHSIVCQRLHILSVWLFLLWPLGLKGVLTFGAWLQQSLTSPSGGVEECIPNQSGLELEMLVVQSKEGGLVYRNRWI